MQSFPGARPARAHGHHFGRGGAQQRAHGRRCGLSGAQQRAHRLRFGHRSRFFNSHASFCSLIHPLDLFLPPILEHLFLHKIERGLMSFYTQNKQQFHSKFHKSMISMYCSFHLKLCIFLSMYPQKSCTIQDKCEVKYVKLWSLSTSQMDVSWLHKH